MKNLAHEYTRMLDSKLFLSRNGYSPRLWGPSLWFAMTIIASNYPLVPTRADEASYYRFFDNLRRVLPCKSCRAEYTKMIKKSENPELRLSRALFHQAVTEAPGAARKRVFTWIVKIHNDVNKRLKKRRKTSVSFWAKTYASLRLETNKVNALRFPTGNL